jgi:Family of unknown function (DUF5996)
MSSSNSGTEKLAARPPDFTANSESWPALKTEDWKETCSTLHMWTQIVGKVRLALSPLINHWWEVPLYISARGLTTSPIPFSRGIFEIEFDFQKHIVTIQTSSGGAQSLQLRPRSVSDFYKEFTAALQSLGITAKIWPVPVEIPNPIPFDKDFEHASYVAAQANSFWRILVSVDTVFKEFRSRFIGKDSPVHFFWGSFDLCVTRFSGRRAPARQGADPVTREAYSHEVISAGFWPGSGEITEAAFYVYAAPEPAGFGQSAIRPASAFYHPQMHEFFLMYEDVRRSPSPRETLLEFLQSTYEAGAELAQWERTALERAA